MSGKVRVGIVGAGVAVRELHLPVLARMTAEIDVVAVAARAEDRAAAVCRLFEEAGVGGVSSRAGVRDLLDDPGIGAVLIAVPIDVTPSIVRAAIAAGKHVLAEKPLADSVSEAVAVWTAARDRGVVLSVGENYRFQPDWETARKLVSEGVIGTPRMFILNDVHCMPPDGKYTVTEWRRTGTHRGGYLVDGGTHMVAVMRHLIGRPLEAVHGLQTAFHPEYLSGQSDTLLLNLAFEGSFVGQLTLGYGAFDAEARHPKVYGTEGTLAIMPEAIEVWTRAGTQRVAARSGQRGFDREWESFLTAIRDGADWEPLVRESIIDLAVITAGIESASLGGVVAFPGYLRASGVPVV
ncbi:MAG TPA: Gfo/Idh/MocA family oxidoreductase [Candidatus Dormibacteraeota bacterium]|nr:Gfo/Idh/MocA family oxidoreductase [Candidatus Dormibacteraeota bacterium]